MSVRALALLFVLAPSAWSLPQSFSMEELLLVGGFPFNKSTSDNVDFGDVDRDGDWDVVTADGGDMGNDQNRLWVNQGGLQGGLVGTFLDETATQLPDIDDDSRDLEFADIDDDLDLDIYVSNTASITNQGSRWWINDGGTQGGTIGFYTDETGARWVDLGGPTSSIPDSLLLPNETMPETFIDWSCDSDFGDLDSDGDLDLVHSSYGGAFGGSVPTRLFLNDGAGYFEEFNPSGFTLPGSNIQDGHPGLWCEGSQQADTTLSDGSECDVSSSPEDIDVGDIDGDLDLDILHGSLHTDPRMFENRLEENGGTLGFRDVTGGVFAAGYAEGNGHFEQEMGDLDNDADLDIYGINWIVTPFPDFGFWDVMLENDGDGNFAPALLLPASSPDDNEGDFIDYDGDGLLDLLAANFSGANRLVHNDGALTFSDATAELPVVQNLTTMDADVCDLENDGDYDFVEATNGTAPNRFFVNNNNVPDTSGALVRRLERVAGHAASASPDPVRAQVYDNAPYYITYFNETVLEISVDGIAIPDVPTRSSGGQIFRGELPGNLVGDVVYRLTSRDQYGNEGSSPSHEYTNTGPTGTLQGGTADGPLGTPTLRSLTAPFAGAPLHLVAGNATPGSAGLYLFSLAGTIPGGLDLGDGIVLNLALPFAAPAIVGFADANGDSLFSLEAISPAASGLSIHAQCLLLDGTGGNGWSSTQSLTLDYP